MAVSTTTSSSSSSAQVDLLPIEIRERIFSLLPVSTLAISTSVSKLWRSLILSPTFLSLYPLLSSTLPDLYFLLFSSSSPSDSTTTSSAAAAYRPHEDLWVSLPLPAFSCPTSCCGLRRIHASGGSHLLVERRNGLMVVFNLFTGLVKNIAPMISVYLSPYVVGLFDDEEEEKGLWKYKVVAVSTVDRVHSQVYDSKSGNWIMKGEFPRQFAVLGNSVCLDGVMYCLSRAPDCLLGFDIKSGEWRIIDVAMPSLICSHVLEFRGVVYLVGGVEELGDVSRIGIWELDWRERRWKNVGFMPDGLFRRFSGLDLNHFETVDRRGVICFCNTATYSLLFCDLSGMRWWRPAHCPFPVSRNKKSWLGHALEPRVEVIMPPDCM